MGFTQGEKGLHNKAGSSTVSQKTERNENKASVSVMNSGVVQAKLFRSIQFKSNSAGIIQMQPGEEEEEEEQQAQVTPPPQAQVQQPPQAQPQPRFATIEDLEQHLSGKIAGGTISEAVLQDVIPQGLKDEFVASQNIPGGHKYTFELPDRGGNVKKVVIKWHAPDANAATKNPTGNSATRWTAQLRFSNRLMKQDGTTTRKPDDDTHIPIV